MTKKGWFLFAAMAFFWGIPYLLIRIAVRDLAPGLLVFGRTAPAALLLLPLVIARKQFSAIVRHAGWILVFGVVEFGVPWFFMGTAERHITSSLTSLIICGVPLLSLIAARFTSAHEAITPKRLLGLALGGAGVAVLVGLDLGHGSAKWIGLMVLVCFGYAVGPLVLATKLAEVPGPAVVCGATGMVALGWLPYALTHMPHHLVAETWWSMATLSVVCTAAAFLTFFALIQEAGSGRSLVVVYSNTAIAVLLGVIFLHEPLTVGMAIGFPLIVAGSYLGTSASASGPAVTGADPYIAINE